MKLNMYIIIYNLTIWKDMNFQITTKSKCLVRSAALLRRRAASVASGWLFFGFAN